VVLPQYPWHYCRNGSNGITAVLGSKYVGIPWRLDPGLWYYCGYGVGFTWTVNLCMNWGLCICKFQ